MDYLTDIELIMKLVKQEDTKFKTVSTPYNPHIDEQTLTDRVKYEKIYDT